ncbi:MAG: hypothetical protein ACHQ9S_22740 [Candidatus Binatia bacterium]
MDQLFCETLRVLEAALETLEQRVPKPQRKAFKDGFVFRYVEQSAQQALIQKLARVVSGLHAAQILLERGFVQEQAALQRMLDEFEEDITFLVYALTVDELSGLHREYLSAFYEEEFGNPDDPIGSTQKRPMVLRRKIRAYIARVEARLGGAELNPSRGIELSRTLSKTYSGFVHAASPQIMDMYQGCPARFHVSGMLGTPRIEEHRADLWNYFYRGILSFIFAAKAFGGEALVASLIRYGDEFERRSGTNYGAWARGET